MVRHGDVLDTVERSVFDGQILQHIVFVKNGTYVQEVVEFRPGLIIHDDNLIEHAVAGLMAAGVKVPDELQVVAKCNYPLQVRGPLPITMLGLDCRALIHRSLELIDEINNGGTPPKWSPPVQAMFENEVM